jgi:GR25 family glycosyltransferase involved in LPS biosynthesis
MIESIFYFQLNDNNSDFILNDYLSILSIIQIEEPKKIFIYYHIDNLENCVYYKYLIQCFSEKIFEFIKYENYFIHNLLINMKENGGIYIKNNFILINKLSSYFLNDCFFYEDCIYGFSKKCFISDEYKIKIIINKKFEIFGYKQNIYRLKNNIIYNKLNNNQLLNIIVDYNFSYYFNMVNSFLFLKLDNKIEDDIVISYLKESKITYLNLVIYYILGYKFYQIPKNIKNYENNLGNILKGISKIYWLNLKSCIDRNQKMLDLLKNTSILNKRVEAYDGKIIQDIKSNYFQKNNTNINTNNSNYEYAVILSHLTMLKEALNDNYLENDDYVLFLEDDVCLDFGSYWDGSIENIIKNAPNDCELIMLGYFSLNINFNEKYRLWNNDWSAMAYVIKKSSLNKLNKFIDENKKYSLFNDVNVADNYLFRIFKTYVYQFPIFTILDNNTSTFHQDHDDYQKIYKNINYLILNKTIPKYFQINNL